MKLPYALKTPYGEFFLDELQLRRLLSLASQQLATQQRTKGLTQTEVEVERLIRLIRHANPVL